jgi:glycosyltransferase involved in cell wall biosynthesis
MFPDPIAASIASVPLAIVVPTRNSSVFLPRLVRSLQGQNWRDWRLIFIDASSLPGEREFLDIIVRDDSRFSWIPQDTDGIGIYGAMNLGFRLLNPSEWVLFWGGDDWASDPNSLQDIISDRVLQESDLVVCRGRYVVPDSNGSFRLDRATSFRCFGSYRLALFLGSTPPHQCTLIGPGARQLLNRYDDRFRIAADLDYFLSLASHRSCRVGKSSVCLVDVAVGGVSGLEHRRRFHEVVQAYRNAFSFFWPIPFLLRYFQRLLTLCGIP